MKNTKKKKRIKTKSYILIFKNYISKHYTTNVWKCVVIIVPTTLHI